MGGATVAFLLLATFLAIAFQQEIVEDRNLAGRAFALEAEALAAAAAAMEASLPPGPELDRAMAGLVSRERELVRVVLSTGAGRRVLYERPEPAARVISSTASIDPEQSVEVFLDEGALEHEINLRYHQLLGNIVGALGAATLAGAAVTIFLHWRRVRAADLEVSRLERRAERIVEALSSALFTVDAAGAHEAVNASARELSPPSAAIQAGRAAAADERGAGEAQEGGRTYAFRAIPLDPGRGLLAVDDVTDVRERERLAEIGEMAASLAHELKNPLTAIHAFAQLAPKRIEDPGFRREFEEVVSEESARLDRFLGRLRTFARPHEPRRERLDLGALAADVLGPHRAAIEALGIAVEATGVGPGGPAVNGDAELLREAAENLLMNARDALAEKGRGRIRLSVGARDGRAAIAVSDDGPGMSPEVVARAFKPFFTTKAQGTGLGLPFAARIARAHDGSIEIESRPGGGTVARLVLPELKGGPRAG